MSQTRPPYIKEHTWGEIKVEDDGEVQTYKDAKLFPGGSREWDWNETGTHHSPGIQPGDVKEIIDKGAEVIVLSQGVYERLGVCEETKHFLEEHEVDYHIAETKEAVDTYNKLQKNSKAGALIHSTC